jgi:hypothetical protein
MRARRIAWLALVALCACLGLAQATGARRAERLRPNQVVTATGRVDSSVRHQGRRVTRRWRTYRSQRGGYTIRYPRSWRVNALAPLPGVVFTTFAPRTGAAGIRVYGYPGHGPGGDNVRPDVHCHPVTVGAVSGQRCRQFGTLAPVTILTTATHTYRLSLLGRVSVAVYDRVVNSFRLIPGATT